MLSSVDCPVLTLLNRCSSVRKDAQQRVGEGGKRPWNSSMQHWQTARLRGNRVRGHRHYSVCISYTQRPTIDTLAPAEVSWPRLSSIGPIVHERKARTIQLITGHETDWHTVQSDNHLGHKASIAAVFAWTTY